MTHYTLPGVRRKLHTTASRRYLVVSVFDGRPKVEWSTEMHEDAATMCASYRREFGPGATLLVFDQATGAVR